MDPDLPPDLAALLGGDSLARDGVWPRFVNQYNRLLLKAAAARGGDYDARMDRYDYILERLAADDYRRLRGYRPEAGGSFAGWLTVVARRLCVDFDRQRHGRGGRATVHEPASEDQRRARRRLANLAGEAIDPTEIPADSSDPELDLRLAERHQTVEAALGTLPPRDQLLIRLRFEDDLSASQITDIMDFPTVFHVYRALRRVLDTLRHHLEDEGVTEVSA